MSALRDAFIQQCLQEALVDLSVVAIDCDMGKHTRLAQFEKEFPTRYFQAGISEQHAIGLAAGMSEGGFFPVVSSIAVFIVGRTWEQIRHSVVYNNQKMIILGTHAGFSAGEDGASHQCFEDISLLFSLPRIQIFAPAFPAEIRFITKRVVEEKSLAYIRIGRENVEKDVELENDWKLGDPIVLQYGNSGVLVVSTGEITQEVIKACKSINVTCIHMGSLRPFNSSALIEYYKTAKKVVVVEETMERGTLYTLILDSIHTSDFRQLEVSRMALKGEFGESGTETELRRKHNLDFVSIKRGILDLIQE